MLKTIKFILNILDTILAGIIKVFTKLLIKYVEFTEEHPWALIPILLIGCIKDFN